MKRKTQLTIPAHVQEMDSQVENLRIDVPFAKDVDIAAMTAGDADPLFVTVEVLNPQVSRNKNNWTETLLYDVAEQINEKKPDGFMGHLTPEELSHKAPEVQTMWLGAKVVEVEGVKRLYAKGYVLPYAVKLRTYLKTAKSAGKKVAVSVSGIAEKVLDRVKQVYDIVNFKLESIDWTRNGSEGVAGLGAFSLTSEMQEELIDQEANMEKSEIIAEMTEKDLKKHNPDLLASIQESARTQSESRITEMQTTVVTPLQEQVQTLTSERDTAVTEAKAKGKRIAEMYLDKELERRVDSKAARQVIRKLVVTEMENPDSEAKPEEVQDGQSKEEATAEMCLTKVLTSDEGKALLSEMSVPRVNAPADQSNTGEARKYTVIN